MCLVSDYELAVRRVAACMAVCRSYEKGGEPQPGWYEARDILHEELRKQCAKFPGMDFDLMDDAAQLVINQARKVKNRREKILGKIED